MTFVKIQLGDLVFDKQQKVDGKVTFINNQNNTAKVEVITNQNKGTGERTTKLVECRLFNLTVIESKTQTKKSKSLLKIKVKYFNKDITKLSKITKGDWIDLRVAETVELKAGESVVIKLGVGMKLPEGFEANVVPRSSTFKNYGIIQTNHYGVIDNSYSGNEDEWRFPVYATRDTVINFDDRVCQFRIQRKMPDVEIEEVEELDAISRGGLGSTGIK